MIEGPPILECFSLHNLIIPLHEFQIILFRMPTEPGNEVTRANASSSGHIPQFGGKAEPTKMVVDIIIHSAVRYFFWSITKPMIGRDAWVAYNLRTTITHELIYIQVFWWHVVIRMSTIRSEQHS